MTNRPWPPKRPGDNSRPPTYQFELTDGNTKDILALAAVLGAEPNFVLNEALRAWFFQTKARQVEALFAGAHMQIFKNSQGVPPPPPPHAAPEEESDGKTAEQALEENRRVAAGLDPLPDGKKEEEPS